MKALTSATVGALVTTMLPLAVKANSRHVLDTAENKWRPQENCSEVATSKPL
jgi:hypothetical protein